MKKRREDDIRAAFLAGWEKGHYTERSGKDTELRASVEKALAEYLASLPPEHPRAGQELDPSS